MFSNARSHEKLDGDRNWQRFGRRMWCGYARREALARRYADDSDDTRRHSGKNDDKVVDWMEQVSDQQYRK